MDIFTILSITGVVFVEISVLVYLYRNYITSWNADKWESKAREEGWLSSLLDDVIVEVAEMVSSTVIERLKFEYKQAQGTLTRVSKSGETSPEAVGLEVAESMLKSMGWKQPNVLLVAKLASTLKGMVSEVNTTKKQSPLPVGKGLFGTQ
jgi:hypothetical protein